MNAIAKLERVVRAQAARAALGTPASNELLTTLDAVTSDRRPAAASHELPGFYVVTLAVAGAAMIVNAMVLTLPRHQTDSVPHCWVAGHRRAQPGPAVRHWHAVSRRDRGKWAADRLGYTRPEDGLLSPVVLVSPGVANGAGGVSKELGPRGSVDEDQVARLARTWLRSPSHPDPRRCRPSSTLKGSPARYRNAKLTASRLVLNW